MTVYINRILILIFITGIFLSCSEKRKNTEKPESDGNRTIDLFIDNENINLSYSKSREIYRIDTADLNNDGRNEIIILSADEKNFSQDIAFNFDYVEIFSKGKDNKFKKILSENIDFGEQCLYENLSNEKSKQIIIRCNAGGFDPVASSYSYIYNLQKGDSVFNIFEFDTGKMQIDEINGDNIKEIILYDNYWGVLSHDLVIPFIKDIYNLSDGEISRVNTSHGKFFNERIKNTIEKYDSVKTKIIKGEKIKESGYPVYREFMEVVLYFSSKEDIKGMMEFYNRENEFIKKQLPEEQLIDIENFISFKSENAGNR